MLGDLLGNFACQLRGVILGGSGVTAGAGGVRVRSVTLLKSENTGSFGVRDFPGFLDWSSFSFTGLSNQPIHAPVRDDEIEIPLLQIVDDFAVGPIRASLRPFVENHGPHFDSMVGDYFERLPELSKQLPVVLDFLFAFRVPFDVNSLPWTSPRAGL